MILLKLDFWLDVNWPLHFFSKWRVWRLTFWNFVRPRYWLDFTWHSLTLGPFRVEFVFESLRRWNQGRKAKLNG